MLAVGVGVGVGVGAVLLTWVANLCDLRLDSTRLDLGKFKLDDIASHCKVSCILCCFNVLFLWSIRPRQPNTFVPSRICQLYIYSGDQFFLKLLIRDDKWLGKFDLTWKSLLVTWLEKKFHGYRGETDFKWILFYFYFFLGGGFNVICAIRSKYQGW